MTNKETSATLDRTMQDLRNNQTLYGGAMILLVNDFCRTLPMISWSTPFNEFNACLQLSVMWKQVKTFKLSIKICIHLQNETILEK